jgi:hypothetical protein
MKGQNTSEKRESARITKTRPQSARKTETKRTRPAKAEVHLLGSRQGILAENKKQQKMLIREPKWTQGNTKALETR